MRIEGKRVITFTIDKDVNYSIHLADTENKTDDGYKTTTIEVCTDKIGAIASLFSNSKYAFVGFGNKYKDNIIVNYILTNQRILTSVGNSYITEHIEQTLVDILEKQDENLEKQYKYVNLFNSIDLQVFMFSKDQKVSLEQFLKASDFKYTDKEHNALNIANILDEIKPRIDARLKVEEMYDEDLFDAHEGVVGARLMKSLYLKQNKLKWSDIKDKHNDVKSISFKDIILPNIKFERKDCNEFLDKLKTVVITPDEPWWDTVDIDGKTYGISLAGLRLNTDPVKLRSDVDGEIFNIDVASFWPSIICNYDIKPKQVNDTFLKNYKKLWKQRLEFKKTDKDVSTTMKYMLNGIIGQFMIENSWLYDPEASMRIRLNGALLMMMLVERLIPEFEIQCVTIDGMFVKSQMPNQQGRLAEIVNDWSKESKLNADITRHEFVYMMTNNDYVSDSSRKGFFVDQGNTGHSGVVPIVRDAVIEKLINNVPISDTIEKCNDIKKFMFPVSSSKDKLEWMGFVFNTERFYASTDSQRVNRIIPNPSGIGDQRLVPTTECSVDIIDTIPEEFPCNVNYRYYISEAIRIVSKINETQLTLF